MKKIFCLLNYNSNLSRNVINWFSQRLNLIYKTVIFLKMKIYLGKNFFENNFSIKSNRCESNENFTHLIFQNFLTNLISSKIHVLLCKFSWKILGKGNKQKMQKRD